MKNPDGSFRFDGGDIVNLLNIEYLCPQLSKIILDDKSFSNQAIASIAGILEPSNNYDLVLDLYKNYKNLEIVSEQIPALIKQEVSAKDLKKLKNITDKVQLSKLSEKDLVIACQFADLYGKKSINESP